MNGVTTSGNIEQPFTPSMIDRLNDWVGGFPLHPWVFYASSGIVLVLIQLLILWLVGGIREVELLPVIIFNGLAIPILIGLFQLLDQQAVRALRIMLPVLDTTEADFQKYQYEIANMPAWIPLVAGLITLVVVILLESLSGAPERYSALEKLPVFNIVFYVIDKGSAFLYGVFFYHTIRQLRLVNANLSRTHINLFNLGPLQAFSSLTATTAMGLVVGFYAWVIINPELLSDPVILGIMVVISILALLVFGWPLYGVHRRMQVAKEKAIHEVDLRLESVFLKFNQHFDDDNAAAMEGLAWMISSLEVQHRRISAIPTWPWKPETARFALTAIALPLILAVLQLLVKQAFGV